MDLCRPTWRNWLAEQDAGGLLPARDYPLFPVRRFFFMPPLLTKFAWQKKTEYCPRSSFGVYLWAVTRNLNSYKIAEKELG